MPYRKPKVARVSRRVSQRRGAKKVVAKCTALSTDAAASVQGFALVDAALAEVRALLAAREVGGIRIVAAAVVVEADIAAVDPAVAAEEGISREAPR
jgi:hypothetical protein